MEFAGIAIKVVEADSGLIITYRMRPVPMVSVLASICRHATATAMSRCQSGPIGLDVLSDIQLPRNVLGPCGQRHGIQLAWSAPPWSLVLTEHSFVPRYEEGCGLLLMWSPSIDTHVASHELGLGFLDCTFWHSSNSGPLLRKPKTNRTLF